MHEIPNLPFPSLKAAAQQPVAQLRSKTDATRKAGSERPEERSAKARTDSPAPRPR